MTLAGFSTSSRGVPVAMMFPPSFAPFRAELDHPVARLDHLQIVLDDKDRIAVRDEVAERPDELPDIAPRKAGRRLVEKEEPAGLRLSLPTRNDASLRRCASPPESEAVD